MIIKELLISLGYEVDSDTLKDLKKFEDGVLKAVKRLAKLIAVAAAAAAAIVAFVAAVQQSVDTLGKSAQRIGIAVEELDALRFAAEIATGSADGLDGALESLSRTASEAARGMGAGVEVFGLLHGVSPTEGGRVKDAQQLMGEVADALKGLDRARQLELAEKLGLGNFILLLDQGSEGIAKLTGRARELGIVTAEDARIAAEFNDAFTRTFGRLTKMIGVFVSARLAPVITEIVDALNDFLVANKELIKQELAETMKTVGVVLKLIFGLVAGGIKLVAGLVKLVGGLNNALRVLLVTFGLLFAAGVVSLITSVISLVTILTPLVATLGATMLAAFTGIVAPIAAVVALLVLIGLVIGDIIAMEDGVDSFFGKLVDKFPIIEQIFTPLAEVLLSIENVINNIIALLSGDISLTGFVDKANKELSRFGNAIRENPSVANALNLFIPGVGSGLEIGARALNAVSRAGPVNGPVTTPEQRARSRELRASMNQTNNVTVNVNGGDPDQVRRATEEALTNAGRQAIQDLKSGIEK